jgi:hypothetical protein
MNDKDIVDILSALLTPLIAVIMVYIAYQQFRINRFRLRYELYEHRLAVFKAVRSFLSDILREGKTDFQRVTQFYADVAEADFLFYRDVTDLREIVYKRGLKLAELHEELYPSDGNSGLPVGKERSQIAHEQSEMLKWFSDQLVEIKPIFKKYLSIGKL